MADRETAAHEGSLIGVIGIRPGQTVSAPRASLRRGRDLQARARLNAGATPPVFATNQPPEAPQ